MIQKAKCLTGKFITCGIRATGRSTFHEKSKKKHKDKVCGENASEKLSRN